MKAVLVDMAVTQHPEERGGKGLSRFALGSCQIAHRDCSLSELAKEIFPKGRIKMTSQEAVKLILSFVLYFWSEGTHTEQVASRRHYLFPRNYKMCDEIVLLCEALQRKTLKCSSVSLAAPFSIHAL